MNVASVIVDVPTMQTDRVFDFLIPNEYDQMIQPGMRVVVPFGSRKLLGFVVEIKSSSEMEKLKEIIEPMDFSPVLTKELLALSNWIVKNTFCFHISALQMMLPTALKAKYEKKWQLLTEIENLHPKIRGYFETKREISLDNLVDVRDSGYLHQEVQKGNLVFDVVVKDKGNIKKQKFYQCTLSTIELQEMMNNHLRRRSSYFRLLSFLIQQKKDEQKDEQKDKESAQNNAQQTAEAEIYYTLNELMEMSDVNASIIREAVKKGVLVVVEKEMYRKVNQPTQRSQKLVFTPDQQAVFDAIQEKKDAHSVFLLHGVTGSGKTEIYLQAIEEVLSRGKEAIVLVPEISLTPMMVDRFISRFGNKVAVLHSGLSQGEKFDEWRKIQRKEVQVVVGARSAIFAPFENIGIVIIDEEHENSYKQEETPRYHARDVAIERAKKNNCPVLLGSATPSLESYARAMRGVYQLLTLKTRINQQPLPKVEIVDMRNELRDDNRSVFSRVLVEKIIDRIQKKEQVLLLLNKRGYSSFLLCRDCGTVFLCPQCDVSLTYHRVEEKLKCHLCGHDEKTPQTCSKCSSHDIRYFGSGTQKIEEYLVEFIPGIRILRMDFDTTSTKGSHERILRSFEKGEADVLLGTQMIAKGLDFPNITLVGVLHADMMLHLPDFRSSERTFQLLTQVSGRAGRHEKTGEVIVQTYTPEHYSIQLAALQDFEGFYEKEMNHRKIQQTPPFTYLVQLTCSHQEKLQAAIEIEKIAQRIRNSLGVNGTVLGPVASPIARINNRYRFQCVIKYKRDTSWATILKEIHDEYGLKYTQNGIQLTIDMNPVNLM